MEKKNVSTVINFSEGKIYHFSVDENDSLKLFILLKNEKKVIILAKNIPYFFSSKWEPLYEFLEIKSTFLLEKTLSNYFTKIPENHTFKHYQLIDRHSIPAIEFIAESIEIISEDVQSTI